ncbi:ring-opening amidohydrolase [Gloeocapsopsis crepidinum LEGE 06123]|uniref:Cyclic amide hydrolase n=1 Tax=Gloeocapsopsis crepidinum LEGE 06123 TaxID=588587 RepID=A0ABR9USN3_9CHRO|nr:ring-opening amidohydrolase [Gloeocapsopsis crepidinum]MBE9191284.1 ring-opening amidohydrolase [Gloeocapsopsis crepidinum LEGE 06123]
MNNANFQHPYIVVGVFRLPMSAPEDVSGLQHLLETQQIQAEEIVAIIAQTEGTGYARGYASLCMQLLLSQYLKISVEDVFKRIPMMMIGLCGGLMSPHYTVFTRKTVAAPSIPPQTKRLAVGIADTRVLLPEEYGTITQVKLIAQAVEAAIAQAGISALDDVHCVEIKCPAMTPARLQDAQRRGVNVVSTNLNQASSMAKGACALGVGLALKEVSGEIDDRAINCNHALYTNRGSVSAGGEQSACRVLVMGNSEFSVSPYRVGHGVMQDQLDTTGVYAALKSAGLTCHIPLTTDQQNKITQVFVNCGADAVTAICNRRHTMHSDFLSGYAGIMAKAVANAIVASVVGDTMILASAGNEHQGARGSNLVATIVDMEK